MPYVPDQQINTGAFVPTTIIFDVARLYEVDVKSEEFKELLVRLYQTVNSIALVLNMKDSALYVLEEFVTSAQYFNPTSSSPLNLRGVYRKTFNMGPLGAGVTTQAHGLAIGTTWNFVHIYGAATNTTTNNYYPLPFAGAAGNNIELKLDATNVIINNNSGVTFLTSTVVVEYTKN